MSCSSTASTHVGIWADASWISEYTLSFASSSWPCYIFFPPLVAPASLSDHEFPPIWQPLRNTSISSLQSGISFPQGTHVLPLSLLLIFIWCCCSQVMAEEALSGVMSENYWCQSVENIALKNEISDNQILLENHGKSFSWILGGALLILSAQTNSSQRIPSVPLWGVKDGIKSPRHPQTSTLRRKWNANKVALSRLLQGYQ